jgi:hypothetical protein
MVSELTADIRWIALLLGPLLAGSTLLIRDIEAVNQRQQEAPPFTILGQRL